MTREQAQERAKLSRPMAAINTDAKPNKESDEGKIVKEIIVQPTWTHTKNQN